MSNVYRDTDLCKRCGASIDLLTLLNERGLINPVYDEDEAFYRDKDRLRVELVLKGLDLGFTIEDIEILIKFVL